MSPRVAVAFAFDADLMPTLFPAETMARLDAVARVLAIEPIAEPLSAADERVLEQIEVLLTGWGAPTLDAALLDRAPHLRGVVHCAGSVKSFATAELWERGIPVSTAASVNALPVAEYTLGAILLSGKRVRGVQEAFRRARGGWSGDLLPIYLGNYRRVVGIVGASRIGRRVMALLRAHDMEILLTDDFVTEEEAQELGARKVDLDELCRESSIVSLHAPELPSTRHMINEHTLSLMKDGTTFINTARGSLVDTAALEAELVSGRLSAVLDVTDPEPLPTESPLYDLPNVTLTPHIAGSVGNELERIGLAAVEEVERLARGEAFSHRVEPELLTQQA